MRWTIAFLAVLLLSAGCLGSNGPDDPDEPAGEGTDVADEIPRFAETTNVSTDHAGAEPIVDVGPDGTVYLQGLGQTSDEAAAPFTPAGGAAVAPASENNVWRSTDGGQTWTRITPPDTGGNYTGDGLVHAADDGTVYAANAYGPDPGVLVTPVGTTFQSGPSTLHVFRSSDQGDTWTRLPVPEFPHSIHRMWMQTDGSTVHMTVAANSPDSNARPLWYIRSDDRGDTWSDPTIVHPERSIGSDLALGPDGTLYIVVWTPEGETDFQLARSTDGGEAFERLAMVDGAPREGFASSWQSLEAGPNGTLTFVWSQADEGTAQVRYTVSTDQGDSWTEPRKVSPSSGDQLLPWVAASGPGQTDVLWIEANRTDGSNASWLPHTARLTGLGGQAPTVHTQQIGERPLHVGEVCVAAYCSGENGTSRMLDFTWIAHGPEGGLHAAFSSTQWDQAGAFPVYASAKSPPRRVIPSTVALWTHKGLYRLRGALPTLNGWEALLASGLVLGLLAAGLHVADADGTPNVVAAHPSDGDAGRYDVETTVQAPNGTLVEDGTSTRVRTWSSATGLLPTGENRTLTTLTYRTVDADDGTDPARDGRTLPIAVPWQTPVKDGSSVERRLPVLTFSYTNVPGSSAVETIELEIDDRQNDDRHVIETTRIAQGACTGAREVFLTGHAPERARSALVDCLAERVPGTPTGVQASSAWSNDPDLGLTWTLEVNLTFQLEGEPARFDLRMVTSPALSLPVQERATLTQGEPGEATQTTWDWRLTGWADGEARLPETRAPIEPGPQLELTTWTDDGPEAGDEQPLPFGEALDRARQDEDVQAFKESHPGAELYRARYVDLHSSDESRTPSARTDESGCTAPQDAGPALPSTGDDGTPTWELMWSGDGEHLQADVSRHSEGVQTPLGRSGEVDRTRTHTWASGYQRQGLGLPALAPSPEATWERLDRVDRFSSGGDPYIEIASPWDGGSATILDAEVGRTLCTYDPATRAYGSVSESIGFERGRPVEMTKLAFAKEGSNRALGSISSAPDPGPDDGAGSVPTGPLEVGLAAAATGLLVAAGARAIPSLYSRFTAQDVLDSEKRQRLYDEIGRGLGATLLELGEACRMHPSSVDHHVTMLERHGLVEVTRTPAGTIAHQVGDPAAEHAAVLARTHIRSVLEILDQEGRLDSVTGLADRLGVSKSQASRVLDRLEGADLVVREENGRRHAFRLSAEGRRVLGG